MDKAIGILTSGGDTPGLNAAIRAIGKTAINSYNMHLVGFRDGFRGLVKNRSVRLDKDALSGLLTIGGTILGTSRDKPHKMPVGDKVLDMTSAIVETYHKHHLAGLVCLGGGGTQKNAYRLSQAGLNVLTLPKTIDNDVGLTDTTFGFDTALGIATDAIDRLHSTAHSHHRIIVVEIMGHNAGWLALGAGLAGGADVILIPEIPYEVNSIAEAIRFRSGRGKNFSIVAIAEGCRSKEEAAVFQAAVAEKRGARDKRSKRKAAEKIDQLELQHKGNTMQLSKELEALTGLESRVTILGHLQRGGTPSAADRLLATQLGTAAANYLAEDHYGIMVGLRDGQTIPIPLEKVVGNRKVVPVDHPWIDSARKVGVCLGD